MRDAKDPSTGSVQLREVLVADLPVFFEHQRDPEANRMAAFAARDRDAFMAHWSKILEGRRDQDGPRRRAGGRQRREL